MTCVPFKVFTPPALCCMAIQVEESVKYGEVQQWDCYMINSHKSIENSWIIVSGIMTYHDDMMDLLVFLVDQVMIKNYGEWHTR